MQTIEFKAEDLLRTSILLYGGSKSGKSVTVQNFLYLLKDHVDQILVFSPTDASNMEYSKIIPSICIQPRLYKPSIDATKKKENPVECGRRHLSEIFSRQETLTKFTKIADDIKILERVVGRTDYRHECSAKVDQCKMAKNTLKSKIKHCIKDPILQTEKIKYIEHLIDMKIKKYYKSYIDKDLKHLQTLNLSDDEKICLLYHNVKPDLVILFDDYAADIKPFLKSEEFRALFYRGRHYSITTIFTCQDDTDMDPNIRKNAFWSIFAEYATALHTFESDSNKFSRELIEKVKKNISLVFQEKYIKLVYNRDSKQVFRYKPIYPIPDFRFGSPQLWELAKLIEESSDGTSKNKYYRELLN